MYVCVVCRFWSSVSCLEKVTLLRIESVVRVLLDFKRFQPNLYIRTYARTCSCRWCGLSQSVNCPFCSALWTTQQPTHWLTNSKQKRSGWCCDEQSFLMTRSELMLERDSLWKRKNNFRVWQFALSSARSVFGRNLKKKKKEIFKTEKKKRKNI